MKHKAMQYIPPSDVRLSQTEHVDRCLVEFDKDTIVNLPQTEQLQHFAWLRMQTIDTGISLHKAHRELVLTTHR